MEEIETLEWMEYELRLIDIEKSLIDNDYLLPAIEKNYLECVKTWLEIESFIPNRVQTPLVKRIVRILETFFYKVLQKAKLPANISEVKSTITGTQYNGNQGNQVSPRVSALKCTFMQQCKYDQLSEIDRAFSGQTVFGAGLPPSITLNEQNQLKSQLDSRIKSFNIQSTIMELGQIQYSFQSSKNELVFFLNNIQNHVRRVKKIEIQHSIGGELKIMKDEKDAVMYTYEKKLNDLATKVKAQLTDSNSRILVLRNEIKLLNPQKRHSSTQTTNQYVLDIQALKRKDAELNQEKDRLKKLIENYDTRNKQMNKMEESRLEIEVFRNKMHNLQNPQGSTTEVKTLMEEGGRSPQIVGLFSNIQLMEEVIGKQSITRLSKQSKMIVTSKLDGLIKSINSSPTDQGDAVKHALESNKEKHRLQESLSHQDEKLSTLNTVARGNTKEGEKSKKTITPLVNSPVKRSTKRQTQKQQSQILQIPKKSTVQKSTTVNAIQTTASSNPNVKPTLTYTNIIESSSRLNNVEQYHVLEYEKQMDKSYTQVDRTAQTEESSRKAICTAAKLPYIVSRAQARLQNSNSAGVQLTETQTKKEDKVQSGVQFQVPDLVQAKVQSKVQIRASAKTGSLSQTKLQSINLKLPKQSIDHFTNQNPAKAKDKDKDKIKDKNKSVLARQKDDELKSSQPRFVGKDPERCDSTLVSEDLPDHSPVQPPTLNLNSAGDSRKINSSLKLLIQAGSRMSQKSSKIQKSSSEGEQRGQLRRVGCQIATQTDVSSASSVAIQTDTQDFTTLSESQDTTQKLSQLTYDTSFSSQKTSMLNSKKAKQNWKSASESTSNIKLQLMQFLPNISEFHSRKQSDVNSELEARLKGPKQLKTQILANNQSVRKRQQEAGPNLKQLLTRNASLRSSSHMDTYVKAMHSLQEYNIDQHLNIPQLAEKLRQRQDRQNQKWNYHLAKVCDKIRNLGPQYLKKRRLFQSKGQTINHISSQKS